MSRITYTLDESFKEALNDLSFSDADAVLQLDPAPAARAAAVSAAPKADPAVRPALKNQFTPS